MSDDKNLPLPALTTVSSREVAEPRDEHRIKLPYYTLGEEIVNAITHGIGTLVAIAALVLLTIRAATRAPSGETAGYVVGYALFGTTLVIMYLVSTLYHSLARCGAKRVFARLDHSAIRRTVSVHSTAVRAGGFSERFGRWRSSGSFRFQFTRTARRVSIFSSVLRWDGTRLLSRRSFTRRFRGYLGSTFCLAAGSIRWGAFFL